MQCIAGRRVYCIVSIVGNLIRPKIAPVRHLSLVHYCVCSFLQRKCNQCHFWSGLAPTFKKEKYENKTIFFFPHLSHIDPASNVCRLGLIASQVGSKGCFLCIEIKTAPFATFHISRIVFQWRAAKVVGFCCRHKISIVSSVTFYLLKQTL